MFSDFDENLDKSLFPSPEEYTKVFDFFVYLEVFIFLGDMSRQSARC